ncbi:hypothetical protein O3M35_005322 [Rhynocoris fuscipes]|uniref:C3H1-type domain-containing protein n=2 Tax=Rhynocoris fuscipes TaxID=488301 RepID=A0AAW1DHW3_9HEMI
MSKTSKRKAGDSGKSNIQSSSKDQKRPSVFERLGTKASNISSSASGTLSINVSNQDSFCRNWAQTGNCPYGKSCKLSSTHSLVSPSKRSSKKESESKQGRVEDKRIHSTLTRRLSPEVNWETWDQTDLEYEDEKALEKRRQLLQRELELQMKKETRKQDPAKRRCSSTSSCTSSSSGSTTSTGSTSESSVSTLRRNEVKKKRQSTSSPSESERTIKKTMVRTSIHKDSPARKSTGSKKISPMRKVSRRKSPTPLSRKPLSPPKQKPPLSLSGGSSSSSSRRRESPSSRRGASIESKSTSQHRSSSRNRRGRSPKSRPRPRTPDSKPSSRGPALPPPPPLATSRNRSSDRKKDDDRKSSKDDSVRRERKLDLRDKRDQDEGRRSREKAREVREAAREKERLEALERCRERQREREQLAKEKERAREERERERVKRDRERRDRRGSSRERRRPTTTEDKRHDRIYDRYERKVGERERSYERERVRDRAIDRVIERKSADRNRDRSRESYDRPYESRRIIQEEKPYSSPFRSNDRNRNNYETERERDRVGSQEIRASTGYNSAGESDRRPRRDRQTWDNSVGASYQDTPRDKREWEKRDFRDSSREWDTRSRCRGDEGGDDWSNYNAGGATSSDWLGPRSHILPIPHHEERRSLHSTELNEKEHALNDSIKDKETVETNKILSRGSGDEMDEVSKRTRIEEPPPLNDELSDISDEADDILNREDVEFEDSTVLEEKRTSGGVEEENETSVNEPQTNQPQQEEPITGVVNSGTGVLTDDEHMVSLDFEEISDDELEEEAKVNKGSSVGDALGVDWASLIAECRPQRKPQASSAHTYWSTDNILARIGVSLNMATSSVYNNIKQKFNLELEKDQELTQVAGLYRAIKEKHQRRASLVSSALEHKQALSARSDISVRRQLCGLPVVSLESHQTAGFCQWAV